MSAATSAVTACALWLLAAGPAQACGACAEDRIAATYDHAVVTRAGAQHQVLVFTALDGAADPAASAQHAKAAAARTRGVDRASVRAAAAPAALSFALDPSLTTPEAAVAAVQQAAGVPGLRLTVLRVVR